MDQQAAVETVEELEDGTHPRRLGTSDRCSKQRSTGKPQAGAAAEVVDELAEELSLLELDEAEDSLLPVAAAGEVELVEPRLSLR